MSFISDLRDLFHRPDDAEDDGRLTVAALLLLVAHADGRTLEVEEKGIHVLLQARFGLTEEQSDRLLEQAGEVEADLEPSTTLIDRIVHGMPVEERPRLLALAYRVAAIDGKVHEFEDDLIWRTGRLLGLSETYLAVIKADALKNLAPDQARR